MDRNLEYGALIVCILGGLFTGETSVRQFQGPVFRQYGFRLVGLH